MTDTPPLPPPDIVGELALATTISDIADGALAAEQPDVVNDAWPELLTLLEDDPDEGTMGVVQTRVYRLFRLMYAVDLWPERAREASLVKLHGHNHLTNLRKDELNTFAVQAFAASKQKVDDDA